MAKRFHSIIKSYSNVVYDLEIHDSSFSGTSTEFVSDMGSVVLRFDGADRKRNVTIMPASLSFDMLIKNATLAAFITDIAGANESHFIVVLKQSTTIKFVGYAITDLATEENISYPYTFSISAVDGIARLKNLEYNNSGTAYTGTATIAAHINNIITQIGLSSQAGSTVTQATEWLEDSHQVGADLLANTRVNHSLFTKEDTNGNKQYSNPYFVLNEICKTFLSRFIYWDGVYHFQQINKYKTLNTYDHNATKGLRGGDGAYLPALRQSKVIFKYGDTVNVAKGVNITQADSTGVLSGDFKNGSAFVFKGSLQYKTAFSTSFISSNGLKSHRVKFGIKIKIGTSYLDRDALTNNFYSVQNEEMAWDTGGGVHYYEVFGDVINEFNYNFNKVIYLNFVTPNYSGVDLSTALVEIVNLQIIKPDGGTYTSPDITLTWTLQNAFMREDTTEEKIINYEKIYAATNTAAGNSKSATTEIIMGDVDVTTSNAKLEVYDGTNWSDSDAWTTGTLTGKKIGQLLADEILAGQNTNIRLLRQAFIMPTFSPLQRLTYQSKQYLFLRGDFNIESDTVSGEWVEIDVDQSTLTEETELTGDGSTNVFPDRPDKPNLPIAEVIDKTIQTQDETVRNIPISILDTISNGKVTTDIDKGVAITGIDIAALPQGTSLFEGDIIKLIHPVTGLVETVTVAANVDNPSDTSKYVQGNTTLYIDSYSPTQNYPTGAFLVKDTDASPITMTDKVHKALNQTASYTDVSFDLPTTKIDERLHVQRDIYLMINDVHFSITTNMSGERRRITWLISDLDDENILIKLKV